MSALESTALEVVEAVELVVGPGQAWRNVAPAGHNGVMLIEAVVVEVVGVLCQLATCRHHRGMLARFVVAVVIGVVLMVEKQYLVGVAAGE